MSCSVFVHIEHSKELEEKIIGIPGIIPLDTFDGEEFWRVKVPEELFPQHLKECDAHRWVPTDGGLLLHYDPPLNPGNWEYRSHGFEIWLDFEGCIVFIVPCHWNYDHGHYTLIDVGEWINTNLGDVKIKKENVSY